MPLPYPHEPFSCLSTLYVSPRGLLWTSILWSDHPLRQWDYPIEAIWPIAQKVVWQLFCCSTGAHEPVTAAHTHTHHTMQVVENGFAPSSDVWGSFWAAGPLFVVKSGLHSITYQMESTRLSGNLQSYWVVTHCYGFSQKYASSSSYMNSGSFLQPTLYFQKLVAFWNPLKAMCTST